MDPRLALRKLTSGESLSFDESSAVMNAVMDGDVEPAQIAGLLVALAMRGETVDEIAGAATAMRAHAVRVPCRRDDVIDTCGTGGDGKHTFNISTVAAFVAAGAGAPVAKHGNRAMSGCFGSADLLEGLGVNIQAAPEVVARCIDTVGIGFLFAMNLHPAMRHAGPVRKALGIRTIFNLLGPMTNPAGAKRQLIGIFDRGRVYEMALVLARLGAQRALVVHGECGLDEISLAAPTHVAEVDAGEVKTYTITPEQFGLARAPLQAVQVETPEQSLTMANAVLDGAHGPPRDIVLLNAGAALYVADKAATLAEGIEVARRSIDSGAARTKVGELARESNQP